MLLIAFEDIAMKIKDIINPFGITMDDWKDPAFKQGLIGSVVLYGTAALLGWTVGALLFAK